jgi:dipeptidyl aminopeptidase/acylaminoacyl peptidase
MKKMRVVAVALAWAGMVAGLGIGAAQTAGQAAANPTHDGETVMNGAPKRPMTFADLMAMKRVSDPQISPSGKWVMFSVTDVSLEKNSKVNHLWVVALNATTGSFDKLRTGSSTSLRSAQDDKQSGERQVTFGDGESFGRFSPDGKSVSFSLKDQIYLAPWDEAAGKVGTAVQVTNVAGGADGAIWSPDSKRLMFVSDVYPECSVKGGKTNAGVPPLRATRSGRDDGIKAAEPATWAEEDACDKAKDEAAEKSPVKAQIWDALLYKHWDHYTGEKRSHILVVDADGGGSSKSNDGVRDLTPASAVGDAETPTWFLGAPLQYAWAPDSKEIAYVTNLDKVPAASTNNDVFTLRLDEPGAKAVKVSTSPGSDDEPEYSPDGKWLAFRSQKQAGFESDRFRLMVVQRVSESASQRVSGREWSEPKELMPKFDRWVDEFVWAPNSEEVYFASGDAGETLIGRIEVSGPEIGKLEAISNLHELSELEVSRDGRTLVASEMSLDRPTEVSATDLIGLSYGLTLGGRNKELEDWQSFWVLPPGPSNAGFHSRHSITHLNDELLQQLDLGDLKPFKFAGAEGTKVQGFILRPPGFDPGKKYPVKFVMHGGPQTALGDSWSYRWNWELLAADGYVVVGINRRGSTGYGQKFVDEVSGDWGGRAYEDLMKGLDYAEATYPFIDKTRECALGASYGGFMADWILTHNDRFKCIVTHDGMVDPVSAYGTTEEMWFNEWEFRRPEDFPKGWDGFSAGYDPMGHSASTNAGVPPLRAPRSGRDDGGLVGGHAAEPWRYQNLPADQDPFRKWSALRAIENAKTPTLIIHSQKDYRLDVSQGFELYTALQRRGVPARFLYFPDEGHWVLKPQNSQLWYQTVDDWCDRWTKTGKYAEK